MRRYPANAVTNCGADVIQICVVKPERRQAENAQVVLVAVLQALYVILTKYKHTTESQIQAKIHHQQCAQLIDDKQDIIRADLNGALQVLRAVCLQVLLLQFIDRPLLLNGAKIAA